MASEDEMSMMFGSDDEDELNVSQQALSHLPVVNDSLAEIRTIKNIGGERGLFAKFDIPAGSLIISEIPIIVWPECDLTEVENLIQVLQLVCTNQQAIDTTKNLHPRRIEDADEAEFLNVNSTISSKVLVQIAKDSRLSVTEVKRIFLTLQHNGFSSGLYEFLSIANHSCNPNSIKFVPQTTSAEQLTRSNQGAGRHTTASEIWSTRPILKDEEITICYCVPLEMTNSAMHSFLLQHHRFVCQCGKCLKSTISETITTTSSTDLSITTDLLSLFTDITALNIEYYRIPVAYDVTAEAALTAYLSREGLRMLSGMPPGYVAGDSIDTLNIETNPNAVDVEEEGDNLENNTDANFDEGVNDLVAVEDVDDEEEQEERERLDGDETASSALPEFSAPHQVLSTQPSSDPVSIYVENELANMEAELMWYRTEDPANNLKTYSSMTVACEYLLSYYGQNYKDASSDPSSNLHSCIAQLSARILKVSLQAALICIEMFEDIRSGATSEHSRSHSVALRLKCRKYIENITIDKLLFQYVVEVYMKNALLLLRFQRFYLGNEHTDISTTCYDIMQGIDLLCGHFSETEVSDFWSVLSSRQSVFGEYSTVVIQKVEKMSMKHHLLHNVSKRYKQEGDKVKSLYSTIKRFPDSVLGGSTSGGGVGVNRTPGTVYWGSKQALDKLSVV